MHYGLNMESISFFELIFVEVYFIWVDVEQV